MRLLRSIRVVTLRDHVRGLDIRAELEIEDVVKWLTVRRRFWRDYV